MRRGRAGFTLIELVIVMTILAAMAMTVTPVFRGSFARVRADHAARDLYAEIKAAQESAVTEAVEYRVYFDTKENTYWPARPGVSKDGKTGYFPVEMPGGDPIRRPERVVIDNVKGRRGQQKNTVYLAFYPTGISDLGTITLIDAADKTRKFVIETKGTQATIAFPDQGR
jgi:prepilin-type N-terminal cleavage/methylation domain-containing protein